MLVYLVRHGQTDYNRENRCQGWVDIPLNATGRAQAAALGKWFADVPVAAIYASPLGRTRETAHAIAERQALPVECNAGLRELHQGELDGLTPADLARDYPQLLADWMKTPAELVMPGGESLAQLADRAWEALSDIRAAHAIGETLVVVSHNLTVLTLLCRAFGVSLNQFRRFRISPGSLASVSFADPEPTLVRDDFAPPCLERADET